MVRVTTERRTRHEEESSTSKFASLELIIGHNTDSTESVERAIHHAIEIGGGKENPFR